MGHFKEYKEKISKRDKSVLEDFECILNNVWCRNSYRKGMKKWGEISKSIEKSYSKNIMIELQHAGLEHDIHTARLAVKSEMKKYIEYLIDDENREK